MAFEIDDGVITISTAEDLHLNVETKTYDIQFLLSDKLEPAAREKRIETISKLITGSIDASSWRDNGGKIGALKELAGRLLITQSPENHKAIANLIEQLQTVAAWKN